MKATPFRASRRTVGRMPDFPADMPYLFDGNVTCATTRLAFGKASAIPTVETSKPLILKRVDTRLRRSSLEFCSPALRPIQVLGGWPADIGACVESRVRREMAQTIQVEGVPCYAGNLPSKR